MVSFNNKLDAFKQVKDSLLTAHHDENPNSSLIEIAPVETRIILLAFDQSEYSSFIAEMVYPEASGIQQKEFIGGFVNQYGRTVLGLKVDNLEGEKEKFYFDYIPRMVADLSFDSSRLLDDLLSEHQKELMNLNYFGRSLYRQKYFVLLGEQIEPVGKTTDFLDSGSKETELRQILEFVEKTYDFPNGDKIFIGTNASILCSKNYQDLEPVLVQFGFCRSINVFINNYFERIFGITDEIRKAKAMSKEFSRDPRSVGECQEALAKITADCVLMGELSNSIKSAISDALKEYDASKKQYNERQLEFSEVLDVEEKLHANYERTEDIFKLIQGLENEVKNLESQISVIQEKRLQQIFRSIKETGQIQRRTQKANERQDNKMQILEIIMSGSLAFDILALLAGQYYFGPEALAPPMIFDWAITSPVIWLLLNAGVWIVLVLGILKALKWMTSKADDNLTVFINYDKKINIDKFNAWLEKIDLISAETEETDDKLQRTVLIEFDLDNQPVSASVVYDQKNAYLFNISLDISQPKVKDRVYYESIMSKKFREEGIFS
jgi:hypothetical protein